MEPQWKENDGVTTDFQYVDIMKMVRECAKADYLEYYFSQLANDHREEKPFMIIYKSKPIRGITLELWGRNPKYNW